MALLDNELHEISCNKCTCELLLIMSEKELINKMTNKCYGTYVVTLAEWASR